MTLKQLLHTTIYSDIQVGKIDGEYYYLISDKTKPNKEPDVYILYLGTNDIYQGISEHFELNVQKTIHFLKYINPHAEVYVIALPNQYEYGVQANNLIGRHALLIHLPYNQFKEDGIHLVDYEEQARVLVKVRS